MRPAQLRVFDGLRLTTAHLEHLQEAWRSSIQDLREILGLGVVYRGCEVVAAGDSAVTVQPGLAFDLQKNRLVFDEPKTVQVVFEPGTASQYVCLKYDQIEGGKVEDHFTLLWDSCSVVLRPSLPAPPENLVVLARLDKTESGHLTIANMLRPAETSPTTPGAGENAAPLEPATPDTSSPTLPTGETSATVPSAGGTTSPEESDSSPPTATAMETLPLAPASPPPPAWRMRQGITHLAGEPGPGTDLGDLLIGPLRNTLAAPNGADAELRFPLFDTDIALDFPVLSLSCHAGLSVAITFVEPAGAPSSETPPTPRASTALQAQSTTHGEVTFTADGVSQFGVSTMQLLAGEQGQQRGMSALTERSVAHVLFGGFAEASPASGTLAEVLAHLQLLLRVEQGGTAGFKLVCNLVWSGGTSEDSITALQIHKPTLTWNGFLAWKALGASERTVT